MKGRVLLSALIGAVVASILYPSADVSVRLTVLLVSFFLLLGILFCTMLMRREELPRPAPSSSPVSGTEQKKE